MQIIKNQFNNYLSLVLLYSFREVIVMKPVPWIRLNGSINRRVLDRWLGSVLCECIARNGCSAQEICVRFSHMFPANVMFLLEILADIGCLHLVQIQRQDVDIFSEYENIKESMSNL